jgi:hypothetical protein
VRPDQGGELGDFVVSMDFDAAVVEPPRHGLFRLLDEIADVLDLPGGRARPELNRFWKAARP